MNICYGTKKQNEFCPVLIQDLIGRTCTAFTIRLYNKRKYSGENVVNFGPKSDVAWHRQLFANKIILCSERTSRLNTHASLLVTFGTRKQRTRDYLPQALFGQKPMPPARSFSILSVEFFTFKASAHTGLSDQVLGTNPRRYSLHLGTFSRVFCLFFIHRSTSHELKIVWAKPQTRLPRGFWDKPDIFLQATCFFLNFFDAQRMSHECKIVNETAHRIIF